ncbi:hypothetical protein B0H14DRAFT_2557328 [Mycena olivaceomarginata]|nr:hypothetical protein B0H14DRAFT_2557328 [Mycena olivaceomarginata]
MFEQAAELSLSETKAYRKFAFTDTLSNPGNDIFFSVDNAAFWISSLGYQLYLLHDESMISGTLWRIRMSGLILRRSKATWIRLGIRCPPLHEHPLVLHPPFPWLNPAPVAVFHLSHPVELALSSQIEIADVSISHLSSFSNGSGYETQTKEKGVPTTYNIPRTPTALLGDLSRIMSPGTEGLAILLGMLMLPALLRTSVKRSAVAVAILNATVSTHVNFSTKRYWTGLNVMKRMNKGCKNSGTVHWTKTRKKQRQLQELYVVPDLPVQLLCSHYAIEVPSTHGKQFLVGYSDWKRSEQGKHLYWPMPWNIDEEDMQFVLESDERLPNGPESLNETRVSTAHARIGLNNCSYEFSVYSHIINGQIRMPEIRCRECKSEMIIFIPVKPSPATLHKAIDNYGNGGQNSSFFPAHNIILNEFKPSLIAIITDVDIPELTGGSDLMRTKSTRAVDGTAAGPSKNLAPWVDLEFHSTTQWCDKFKFIMATANVITSFAPSQSLCPRNGSGCTPRADGFHPDFSQGNTTQVLDRADQRKSREKVLNVTGTVDQLRANLAAYYGFDLTVNPREDVMTAPNKSRANAILDLILSATQPNRADDQQPIQSDSYPTVSTHNRDLEIPSSNPAAKHTIGAYSNHSTFPNINSGQSDTADASRIISGNNLVLAPPHSHPRAESSAVGTHQSNPSAAEPAPHEAALLQDFSKVIEGLEKCEGLQDVVQQIESGAVKAIRTRYGPVEKRHGTADPLWPKYKNPVSKRERLYKVVEQDFEGNKERRESAVTRIPLYDRLQSYRKIVEAKPWCEADLEAERQKEQYRNRNGEFAEDMWTARWGAKNFWEVWREMKRERYVKEKKSG